MITTSQEEVKNNITEYKIECSKIYDPGYNESSVKVETNSTQMKMKVSLQK